jgi:hypothetical protein
MDFHITWCYIPENITLRRVNIRKEAAVAYLKGLRKTVTSSAKVVGILAEIHTGYLLNSSLMVTICQSHQQCRVLRSSIFLNAQL